MKLFSVINSHFWCATRLHKVNEDKMYNSCKIHLEIERIKWFYSPSSPENSEIGSAESVQRTI